ncbi:hypothetical protein Tco_0787611 [Tanacetum coccineum]
MTNARCSSIFLFATYTILYEASGMEEESFVHKIQKQAARKQLWAVETVILYRASRDVVVQDLLRDDLSTRRVIDGFSHDF